MPKPHDTTNWIGCMAWDSERGEPCGRKPVVSFYEKQSVIGESTYNFYVCDWHDAQDRCPNELFGL